MPISDSAASWRVVHAELQAEHIAFNSIQESGFVAFFPRILSATKGHAARILPLFPRYLFVSFNDADPWGKILRCRGVARLITFLPGQPARVPDAEIVRLMALGRAGDGVIDDRAPKFPRLMSGDSVEVLDGAFAGWKGIVERSRDERVRVLLEMLGGPRGVEMHRSMVAPVEGVSSAKQAGSAHR